MCSSSVRGPSSSVDYYSVVVLSSLMGFLRASFIPFCRRFSLRPLRGRDWCDGQWATTHRWELRWLEGQLDWREGWAWRKQTARWAGLPPVVVWVAKVVCPTCLEGVSQCAGQQVAKGVTNDHRAWRVPRWAKLLGGWFSLPRARLRGLPNAAGRASLV